jgi:hypothetical protein
MKLAIVRNFLAALIMLAMCASALISATQDESKLLGDWRGDSTCAATGTACRDEKVVYHIAKIPGKPSYVSVSADKVVNGAGINMGTLEFSYDPNKQTLSCEYVQGVWRITVDGNKMEGTLTRPDKTIFRRVTLKKEM